LDSLKAEQQRQLLIDELSALFVRSGLKIIGSGGSGSYDPPPKLRNEGYGDQEDKRPDIFAIDETTGHYVIGLARLGVGDLETDHALTQYNVFLDQFDPRTGERARMIVILRPPKSQSSTLSSPTTSTRALGLDLGRRLRRHACLTHAGLSRANFSTRFFTP